MRLCPCNPYQGICARYFWGVDSTLGGKLAQLAAKQLRNEGYEAQFIAVRLPYGVQADEKMRPGRLNGLTRIVW